jgi:hypothetical protein
MMHSTYVLLGEADGRFSIGVTEDLKRRVKEHGTSSWNGTRIGSMKNSGAKSVLLVLAAGWALLGAGWAEPGPKSVLPFISDDYSSALAQARAKKLPIFVEAWAPW